MPLTKVGYTKQTRPFLPVRRVGSARLTKVSVSLFSADISKSEEISRWRPIDKTLHYDFSATETFFLFLLKTAHPQRLAFRKQCPRNIKIEYLQRIVCNTHTHTHTDKLTNSQTEYYNPPPMRSGLIKSSLLYSLVYT